MNRGAVSDTPRKLGLQGWRKWLARMALLVGGAFLPLLLTELGLRLLGYGYPTSFFLRDSPTSNFITNEKYAWQFYSRHTTLKPFLFRLPPNKPPGTVRIFILGESAAMGTPDPAFSFSRILQAGLRRHSPNTRFEIINAAMRGINSYVIDPLAEECAIYQPDLFIIYMGNNEMSGLHAPDPSTQRWTQSVTLYRAYQSLRSSKLGQLFDAFRHSAEGEIRTMDYFRQHSLAADDPRRQKVYDNFRRNLERICRTVTNSGAKTLLCTVAVNLQHCPPFESKHRQNLSSADHDAWERHYRFAIKLETEGNYQSAISEYLLAAHIDDHYAELLFRLGRACLATGNVALARQYYASACDWDALQFRTDSQLNSIIRSAARAYQSAGITLLDIDDVLKQSDVAEHGIPGNRLFHEHVHPTFAGNYMIARACFDKIIGLIPPGAKGANAADFPTQQECADALAFTEFDSLEVEAAFLRLTDTPPFLDQLDHTRQQAAAKARYEKRRAEFTPASTERCLTTYQNAIRLEPDFWPLRYNLGNLYRQLGRPGLAAEQFRSVVEQFPRLKRFRVVLGNTLIEAGDKPGALTQFEQALLLDPRDNDLKQTIQRTLTN